MEKLIPDIYEKILVRLDGKTVGRCKCVCKSWESLISEPRFIKAHLHNSNNSNHNGHKRLGEAVFVNNDDYGYAIIGSSNGLVCLTYGGEILVGNPLTREVITVPTPSNIPHPLPTRNNFREVRDRDTCWGFGYDSLGDDYKVVCGVYADGGNYFQVFSLKSYAWKAVVKVNYARSGNQNAAGVLCNGAIHWVMHTRITGREQVVLSFDLSKEKLEETPLPADERFKKKLHKSCLSVGIMEECLCLTLSCDSYIMKRDNAKQSWEMVKNFRMKNDQARNFMKLTKHDVWRGYTWFIGHHKFRGGPPVVESLVSPHLEAENE